jgi:hypothetical protein
MSVNSLFLCLNGAGGEIRTRDLNLIREVAIDLPFNN